jgi:hypothetical protein
MSSREVSGSDRPYATGAAVFSSFRFTVDAAQRLRGSQPGSRSDTRSGPRATPAMRSTTHEGHAAQRAVVARAEDGVPG